MRGEPNLSKRALGQYGENLAARWYESNGYEVVDRNWRCAAGEIDLICRNDDTLVFSEVKTRSSSSYGFPVEAVTRTKQLRIRKIAGVYLAEERTRFSPNVRFDVVSINAGSVEVIENAF